MSADQPSSAPHPLRVVLLTHTGEVGGAELAMARMTEALPPEVEVIVVLGADGPLARRLEDAGTAVRIEPMPDAARTRSRTTAARSRSTLIDLLSLLPYLWRLRRRIAGEKPDVVCSNSLKSDLVALPVCWSLRVPLVWFVHDRIAHDYLPRSTVRLFRALARLVSGGVIANSKATAATLPRARPMTIAYPGYSPDQVAHDRGLATLGRERPEPPLVGLLGRVSPTKGQLEFVRAAAIVRSTRPDVGFVIAGAPLFGEEAYAEKVRAEITGLGLGDAVQMVGQVADPRTLLDVLAIAVHASPVPEPFGQVVIEAMIRGVPVIATSGGGIVEIMVDGALPLGWLVPAGDSAALAAAIVEVLDNPEEASARAVAAYGSATQRFPRERMVTATVQAWSRGARRTKEEWDVRVSVSPHKAHGGNA